MAKEQSENKAPAQAEKPVCFVIMPIADPEGYDKGHFSKVYEDIFRPACASAGFSAVRADEVKQTNLIHLDILQKLIESPMAICDLSGRNPNVLFELGLRQAFDKPTVLVQEVGTPRIFDIAPLRYTEYRKELRYRDVLEDQTFISDALKATAAATGKGEGVNSIVKILSLSKPASLKEVNEGDASGILQLVRAEMSELRSEFRRASFMFERERDRARERAAYSERGNYIRSRPRSVEEEKAMLVQEVSDLVSQAMRLNEAKAPPEKVLEVTNRGQALATKLLDLGYPEGMSMELKNYLTMLSSAEATAIKRA